MSMIKKILINASNLHVGGGVQVAASFIHELSGMLDLLAPNEVVIYVSSIVHANLCSMGFDEKLFVNYSVLDVKGVEAIRADVARKFSGFDLVFTIFGPLYLPRCIPNHIMGFAQPWIIYPNNEVKDRLSLSSRFLTRLKFEIQWRFFKRAERLIVELPHVKDSLWLEKSYPEEQVDTVYNCVSRIYFDQKNWKSIPALYTLPMDIIRIGYVGRDYTHKNLDILPQIHRKLKQVSNKKYRFFVTLSPEEWANRSSEFRECVFNIGPITTAQCPSFYQCMDAVVFPSLLECFSVTPLEAMVMKRPLFASERRFIRDSCGDNALVFDPLDAQHAASIIDNWFCRTSEECQREHLQRAYRHLISMPDSQARARNYIEIINRQLAL